MRRWTTRPPPRKTPTAQPAPAPTKPTIALDEYLEQPKTLILRGKQDAMRRWQSELGREFLPDTEVLAIADGMPELPALLDKPPRPQPVNGWLCRGAICLEPLSDLVNLKRDLKAKT